MTQRSFIAVLLMAASGFAGLGYQIVWTRQGALWLGHETPAVLAVVGAFFGGLALGALLLAPRIERSARPLRWYAACELAIGAWSLALALGLGPVARALAALLGAQPAGPWTAALAFAGTFVLLLPATAAMGATLPALERALATAARARGQVARLYAANTAGALVGVLAAAFVLVPQFGLARSAALCAGLNGLCALLALHGLESTPPGWHANSAPPAAHTRFTPTLARLFGSGLLGIGYEVLVVRVLSQVAEDTVYTFALLLAVYLVGTALGAALYARYVAHRPADAAADTALGDRLVHATALACAAGAASLWGAEALQAAARPLLQPLMGELGAALAAEALPALAAFGLPTVAMGALFSHLCRQAQAEGTSLGAAFGLNTLGAALAPLLFGVLLLPALGPKPVLLALCAAYLLLARARALLTLAGTTVAAATLVLALATPPLAFVDVPEGGHVLSYRDGAAAAVSVVEDADGVARLRIDNRQQEGSSGTLPADGRQALLPLLLHPAPRHALFLGLGTGLTASVAAQQAGLQVDAVELLPEVIEASTLFTDRLQGGRPAALHLLAADARRYVRAARVNYDVIVADNFHPARSGAGALYTVEHFQAVRGRLAPQGLFCQWLPLHQLDLATLRSIVRSFMAVYPQGYALLATNSLQTPVLGLVGSADGGRKLDPAALHARMAHEGGWPFPLATFGLPDALSVLGGIVAGPQALARFGAPAPLNTDDHPVVAYLAPRITYAPDSTPGERLLALLSALQVSPGEVLAAGTDFNARLAAYWQARDRFLAAGRDVQPSADVRRMLAQVGTPLLQVLQASPDFRPAYEPLLRMAQAVAAEDPAEARRWLQALARAAPQQPEAGEALQVLAR